MFHPKLSFSFHAEIDRAVDIANENRFRIKENKSVLCEVAMSVVAFLLPPFSTVLPSVQSLQVVELAQISPELYLREYA